MRFIFNNLSLLIILIVGFALRISAIIIDPFLHPWDERFHALVARNIINNPFVPILRVNPITDNYNPTEWCCNHIWLHKQPLFMWQMALSMKIFGVSEWSMRLPSAIMGTLLILLIYRIAILITENKNTALFAAAIVAFSNFYLQMISGIHGMDHNDVAHGFYILASIWALCEYKKTNKLYWIFLIGIFAGGAILNKWLTGLLVYLIWGIYILESIYKKEAVKKPILLFIVSLIVCGIVFLPWQLYITTRFPELAKYEYEFNRRHITEVLEGHSGSIYYYLQHLKELFGNYLYYLIPIGIFLSFRDTRVNKGLNYGVIGAIGFVFLFFSLIVKTKVDTHIFFIIPLAMLYISIALSYLVEIAERIMKPAIIFSILILIVSFLSLNPNWFLDYLSPKNVERNNRIYNATIYRDLKSQLPKDVHVVMNVNSFEDIDVMFYNEGITAYHWTLSEEDFKNFDAKKIPIAVFEPHGSYNLPEYVAKYKYLHIIHKKLFDF